MNDEFQTILMSSPEIVAPRLLGSLLVHEIDGQKLSGIIVETEAYDESDAASHSYKGRTPRTEIMFGPPGHLYVYFTYGMHYCCNVVTGPIGHGAAVLIRALEPIEGVEAMTRNRDGRDGVELTNGPAKLCQALGVDARCNGLDLRHSSTRLIIQDPVPTNQITQATRIGISQAADVPWRFYITGNRFVSKL